MYCLCTKMNSSRPSWVHCVPKMAYFCSNRRHLKHKTVNNNFGTKLVPTNLDEICCG